MTIALLALLGCNTSSTDPEIAAIPRVPPAVGAQALASPEHPTGSNRVATVEGLVFTANLDAGTVTRLDPETGEQSSIDVGVEPSGITVSGDAVYVAVRGERSVVRFSASRFDGIEARVDVGAEPIGIVAREDGARIYVSVSQQDEVVELSRSLVELARFPVTGEPRGLALHPSGAALYVGLGRGTAGLAVLDLIDGAVTPIVLPPTTIGDPAVPMPGRVSGDPMVLPGGDRLVVPVLYLDIESTPIPAVSSADEVSVEDVSQSPYGGKVDDLGKVNPALVEVDLGEIGQPGASRALFLSAASFSPEASAFIGIPVRSVASYVTNVSNGPDGRYLVTMQGAETVGLVDPTKEVHGSGLNFFMDAMPAMDGDGLIDGDMIDDIGSNPALNGFTRVAVVPMDAGVGVDGAVMVGDLAVSNDRFDGTATVLGLESASIRLDLMGQFSGDGIEVGVQVHTVTSNDLDPQLALGRKLFHSTRDGGMGGGGVSCSSCHVDGRTDGVTWMFDDGPRQTPSLAGRVSGTAPVTWRSGVVSVQEEVRITTVGRMGGDGLAQAELDALSAYVDWTQVPDAPTVDHEAAMRGAVVFADAGCGACHSGVAQTDNRSWTLREFDLNTPSLRGIAATAPYLHDGSAATLREVLELGEDGTMGFTSGMAESELDDLVSFLKTL